MNYAKARIPHALVLASGIASVSWVVGTVSAHQDRQTLVALLESAEKQRGAGNGRHAGGPWAAAWATVRAVADALADGSLEFPPGDDA